MENREGQRVPDVTFRVRDGSRWKDLTTGDIFSGKTVVVFSLPGAFTPTCSSSHVPRYDELAPLFREHGVDDIVCIAVNDSFVMNAWKEDQRAKRITFVPDGNGEFTERMGMLVDKRHLGFGARSWRYSMLVRDGVIEKMFIEPERDGDPYEVSDADTMLRYVAGEGDLATDVFMLTRPGCRHCERARSLLREHGLEWEEARGTPRALRATTGRSTTPQVFVDGRLIGGADDLERWLAS